MASTRRDLSRYARRTSEYATADDFLRHSLSGREIVSIGQTHPVDIHVSPAHSDTTVVVFHAALTKRSTLLPVFTGANMLKPFKVNLVQVADPGLYADDELTIGWFAGTAVHPVQQELVMILRHLVSELGGSRTLFFGASAGGFAALYYGRNFPDATIVPVNPQTVLENFSLEHQTAYCTTAWGAAPTDVWENSVDADLRRIYNGANHNDILYIQNVTDAHVELHMQPFLGSIPDERVEVVRGDWGDGHTAPSPEELTQLLTRVLDR
ncbi:hypothetical protein FCK90_13795 [Kocuria coralli]|uniref:Alpha/beta hydrolase n=1 Tax=Kocuria coralli TaxID=1461025 RepID=A0A5J5KTR5_9MICC|nr:hypothetical protein [Kocuria coralli]KAA9393119.1 hypothetical protein FCK90_13795 [Kocuria coralli]